ncbi:hypothetical protein M426DRAFT_20954 [Hypoxylon sp. CI-4A]|nr:hypothetical protein M426DRAFT_20954 [Hypoxylon sp. CI-4A]
MSDVITAQRVASLPASFDPTNNTYNPYVVWLYFSQLGHEATATFLEWRRVHFGEVDARCDRCLVYKLACGMAPGTPCEPCATTGNSCMRGWPVVKPSPPNPRPPRANKQTYGLGQRPSIKASKPLPGGALTPAAAGDYHWWSMGKEPNERPGCSNCLQLHRECDASVEKFPGMSCTSCKEEDTQCSWGGNKRGQPLEPRPDGLTAPLACDRCAQLDIKACGWRQIPPSQLKDFGYEKCSQCHLAGEVCKHAGVIIKPNIDLVGMKHTHLDVTQNLPPPDHRPAHQQESQANPVREFVPLGADADDYQGEDPRQAPNQPGSQRQQLLQQQRQQQQLQQLQQLQQQQQQEPPVQKQAEINNQAGLCEGCKRRLNLAVYKRCEASLALQIGCKACTEYGLFCVLNDVVLPPFPQTQEQVRGPGYSRCERCTRYHLRCDRKRPCDACHAAGLPCEDYLARGCFTRGAPGDNMPLYYAKLGNLDASVRNVDKEDIPATPRDYHLQYGNAAPVEPPVELIFGAGNLPPDHAVPLPQGFGGNAPAQQDPYGIYNATPQPGGDTPAPSGVGMDIFGNPSPGIAANTLSPGTAMNALSPGIAMNTPSPGFVMNAPSPAASMMPASEGMGNDRGNSPALSDMSAVMGYIGLAMGMGARSPTPPSTVFDGLPWMSDADLTIRNNLIIYDQQGVDNNQLSDIELTTVQIVDSEAEAAQISEAIIDDYAQLFGGAQALVNEQLQHLDLRTIRRRLRAYLLDKVPAEQSAIARAVKDFLERRWAATQQERHPDLVFNLPSNANPAHVAYLNLGNAPLQNVTRDPIYRPPSPGPAQAVLETYVGPDSSFAETFTSQLPPDSVFHINQDALVRPLPLFPYHFAAPVLANIPHDRLIHAADPTLRCMAVRGVPPNMTHICNGPTAHVCEDTTHYAQLPVCLQCDYESRQRFRDDLTELAGRMRAFACGRCAATFARRPDLFAHHSTRVWGFAPGHQGVAVAGPLAKANPPWASYGGFQGAPLPVSGCACASKMLDRVVCTPHRLQHTLRLQEAVEQIDAWIRATWGSLAVCFMCRVNPSVDAFGFQGEQGGQDLGVRMWKCKGCHEIVLSGHDPLQPVGGKDLFDFPPPAPQVAEPGAGPFLAAAIDAALAPSPSPDPNFF